jgi:tryptophanyl-tRNA synthetase
VLNIEQKKAPTRHRVLSGMRPTGRLHIGHLFGALDNWVKMQETDDAFFMIADLHALTTGFENSSGIGDNIREVLLDYLVAGVDPHRCTLFLQSQVPEVPMLSLLLSMIVPVGWLERSPTYKDQIRELGAEIATHGFLGYPVLMTADIILFKADQVPVGQDQVAHLELTREIVRRFHHLYQPVFVEPKARLTEFPSVPGTDGRKMSKSYGNSIMLSDTTVEKEAKIKTMITDPRKVYKGDPGRPEICTVYYFHKIYSQGELPDIEAGCRSGALGCTDCKKRLMKTMGEATAPMVEQRLELAKNPNLVQDVLSTGNRKAREVARQTLGEAQDAMGMARTPA